MTQAVGDGVGDDDARPDGHAELLDGVTGQHVGWVSTTSRARTGTYGQPWVELEKPKPPRIPSGQHYDYWGERPPEISARCLYWLRQIERGWLPPARVRCEGYDSASVWYGVYIWEWTNLIYPKVEARLAQIDAEPADD